MYRVDIGYTVAVVFVQYAHNVSKSVFEFPVA